MLRLFLSDERKWITYLRKEKTARVAYYVPEKVNEKMDCTNIGMRISEANDRPFTTGI